MYNKQKCKYILLYLERLRNLLEIKQNLIFLNFYSNIFLIVKITLVIEKEINELTKSMTASNVYHVDTNAKYLGQHVLAEFFECDPNILNNSQKVESLMIDAALECGATIVQKCFHMFSPHGVSGVVIISESHLAIHTWPELGYAAVDLFTCGDKCDPKVAYEFLKKAFHSTKASFSELKRGKIDASSHVSETPFEIANQF